MASPQALQREDYQIGVICALAIEQAAVIATLDGDEHPGLTPMSGDDNQYTFGRIKDHNIVIACLPAGSTGTANACNSEENDVHLGDVVVSQPKGQFGGVVQYDFGKTGEDGKFKRTSHLNEPPKVLLHSLQKLQTMHFRKGSNLREILDAMFEKEPHMVKRFGHPGTEHDQLFNASYDHESGPTKCDRCDPLKVPEDWEARETSDPRIHYGTIASANQVMRHGPTRDRVAADLGAICFEMEAAGLMNNFPCLVIRGICDYADTHKNKKWQGYAAASAAAFAKELLSFIPKQEVVKMAPAYKNEHWIVPRGSSTHFTGRAIVIEEVQERLCNPARELESKQRRFVIVGMGGIGKSEICLKVAENIRESFWGVFWIDVSSTANAERGYNDTGRTCGLPEPTQQEVRTWLAAAKHKWLLILDNADDPETDYAQYFPSGNRGCIILTTRNHQCQVHSNVGYRELDTLDRSEAIGLLLKTTHVEPSLWESHETIAGKVVDVLGSHTLAVVHAGAFIQQGLCSLEDYPAHFVQQRQRLLQFRPTQARSEYGDVYATFEVSAKHLEESAHHGTKIALALLRFLAFVHLDNVPVSIFERAWKKAQAILFYESQEKSDQRTDLTKWHVLSLAAFMQSLPDDKSRRGGHRSFSRFLKGMRPKKWRRYSKSPFDNEFDTISLDQACAALASLSIISIDKTTHTLTIHPLVHAWAMDRLEISERDKARISTGCILAMSLQGLMYEPFWSQLEAHVESYLHTWPLDSSVVSFEVIQCLYNLAFCLGVTHLSPPQAELILMLPLEHESLKVRPKADIDVCCMLVTCYMILEKFSEAKTLLEKKIQAYNTLFEAGHDIMFSLHITLGRLLRISEKTDDAIQLYEEILLHPRLPRGQRARVLVGLGRMYSQFREAKKGILLLEEVVQIHESKLEPEHLDRLWSQHDLAEAYYKLREGQKAIAILEEVVQIGKRIYRTESMDLLVSQELLGRAYILIGEVVKGIELVQWVMHVQATTLQPDSPYRLSTLHHLAEAYIDTGEVAKGIKMLEEVVQIRKRTVRAEHVNRLASEHALGVAYVKVGEITKGIQLLEGVVHVEENTIPKDDPNRYLSLQELGDAYLKAEQVDEAMELLTEVVQIERVRLEEDDLSRLTSLYKLAKAYLRAGQANKAIELLTEVVQIERVRLEEDDPIRLLTLYKLAKAHLRAGQANKAIELLTEVVQIERIKLEEDDPSRLLSLHYLARAYLDAGQVNEAIRSVTEVVQIESATLESDDPSRLESEELLAEAVRAKENGLQDATLGQPSDLTIDPCLSGESEETQHISNALVLHDSSILACSNGQS
ncbi:hypothetical protein EPUS_00845 [Endocarpon pusillum Z07020]|uniref:AAA+ ATPase domain-containing protein n=1 Tax=Endocarpon pusillum (strain Z07020 / HMAS-L-300199) TaxID=1263415 RepID=U1G826_ENDPU|nr:uncharacterized protein EPUS_00845 [Endocarpon pusillum Z07020]ERF73592.1 hypothetical protein EPUS_00845 [Endocarpon pusillum Z07020]